MLFKNQISRVLIVLVGMIGCDNTATQFAREAADRQAQQNTEMAQLNKEVASGSHQLVEADAQARKEIVGVHHDLQAERTQLNTSWNKLADEQREIAGDRRTESMLVAVTKLAGGGVLIALLLAFCWLVLFSARHDHSNVELQELVIHEVLAQEPNLIAEVRQDQIIEAEGQNG